MIDLLAAVDVEAGRAVRPSRPGVATMESADPRELALSYVSAGAPWIHLVDLDAAYGRARQTRALAAVIADLAAHVQLSGGIRSVDDARQALATGAQRIVVAAEVFASPPTLAGIVALDPARVAVALDIDWSRRRIVARGSGTDAGPLDDALGLMRATGLAAVIATDVARDGRMSGPNLLLLAEVAGAGVDVIASGGIADEGDLTALARSGSVKGVIVGRALHIGALDIRAAIAALAG
jgi:phosphoribosyl isomerase A